MNKNNCWDTTSSNCVSNQGLNKQELPTQTQVNDDLFKRMEELESKTDVGSLQTEGTEITPLYSLIDVIQVLVNQLKKQGVETIEVNGDTINLSVDLRCLAGSCDSGSYTLNYLVQVLIQEICTLRQKITVLENKLL